MADEKKPLLNENQLRVAQKIMDMAPKYGVNPDFALGIAMQENMFRDKTSEEGAIGPMQLLPSTAKGLGVDPYDEDDNIKGGMLLIKQLTGDKRVGLDPIRVLVGYHSGPDVQFFQTNNVEDLRPNALNYVDKVSDFTGGTLPSVLLSEEQINAPPPAAEGNGTVEVSEQDMANQVAEKRLDAMKVLGAGAGATASTLMDTTGRIGNKVVDVVADRVSQSMANKPPTGALPTPPAPAAPTARIDPVLSSQTPPQSSAQSTRIMQGGQGDPLGTTGRARQEGYNTETARRAAVANEVKAVNPQARQVLANAPGMTSTPSGVLYPSTEMRPTAGARPQTSALTVRGGAPYQPPLPDQLAGVRPGGDPVMGQPVAQTAPRPAGALPPPKPSLARQAIDVGRKAMNIPVLSPALTGALGGYGAVTLADDARQRYSQGDYVGAGISGVGALGSAAAVIPSPWTRGIGGGLAMAAPMANMIVDYMRQTSPLSQAKQTPTGR
jgi:hypothetical protein